jgi:glycosyltransferase involved in cell wall biosynthesis
LIVDITELAEWQGKPTGVPRVINELAMRFAEDDGATFVVWDTAHRILRPIDYASAAAETGTLPREEPPSEPTPPHTGLVGFAARVKQRSRLLSKAVATTRRLTRTRAKPAPVVETPEGLRPGPGDVLLICADWHGSDQAFVDHVEELQREGVLVAQIAYDLLPLVTPQYSGHGTESLANYVEKVYPICDVILAISEHTKRDICTWLTDHGLRVPAVAVFRLGDDFRRGESQQPTDEAFLHAYDANGRFLLCVGTMEARKNHALLYYTYKLAHEQRVELPPVVVVGRRGWLTGDIYEVMTHDPQTKAKFVFLHDASDEELGWLYRHCEFSIYPSFYEGWGLPIGESLAYGVPCIASRTSSMPEVAGELIPYFSPASADECLLAITAMLRPGSIDEAKRTISRYEPARWDDTFESVRSSVEALRKN